LRREQFKGGLIILAALLLVGVLAAILLADWAASQLSVSSWIAGVVVILTTIAALISGLILGLIVVNLLRYGPLRSEHHVLALARRASGDAGNVQRLGPVTVWWSGDTDPVPLLMENMEAMRARFESLLGKETGCQIPLRILCFRQRSAFETFLKPYSAAFLTFLKSFDGIYLRQPYRIFALCTDEGAYNILDSETTARTLFCYHYVFESFPHGSAAVWLHRGLSKTLTSDDDDRARLNRKVLVSLSRTAITATGIFALDGRELAKLFKGWSNHADFVRLEDLYAQSWSVCEYLGGELASAQRRDQFRGFLRETRLKAQPEEPFKRHFGFGFDILVKTWREWVREQGVGSFTPVPSHIKHALMTRVLPLIEDRQARRNDRILAIRNVGSHGYALGANALIGLLQCDDVIPTEEVVWALEAISGMNYGDNRDRWTAWWNSLPAAIRQQRCALSEN
jgi:hypothetical protein